MKTKRWYIEEVTGYVIESDANADTALREFSNMSAAEKKVYQRSQCLKSIDALPIIRRVHL